MHPNADKLQDGAIQRMSVSASQDELMYVSQNPKGLGSYKRAEVNMKTSDREFIWSSPWDGQHYRHKVVRIYFNQKKHLHCHPINKMTNKYWAFDFGCGAGHFKSNLMGWTRAGHDPYNFMSTPYQAHGMHCRFAKLSDAVGFCESMGWGYDILQPRHRWFTKKNYADNFKWKGNAKPVEAYD